MIQILKADTDIHDDTVTVYKRKETRSRRSPKHLWAIEKDGRVVAWAKEVILHGPLQFVGGSTPAIIGQIPELPVPVIHDVIQIPAHLIADRSLLPRTVICTTDGEVWCPAIRNRTVRPR